MDANKLELQIEGNLDGVETGKVSWSNFKTKLPSDIRDIVKTKPDAIKFYFIGIVGKTFKFFAYCPKPADSSSKKPHLKLLFIRYLIWK